MLAKLIVEKFKKREREIGRRLGLEESRQEGWQLGFEEGWEETQRAWLAWYRRQQEAIKQGLPFDEAPPGLGEDNR